MRQKHTNTPPPEWGFAAWSGMPSAMEWAHGHQEIEMNVLQCGTMEYLLGGRTVMLRAGEVLLFWAAIPHQLIEVAPGTHCHWVTIPFATFVGWALPATLHHQVLTGEPVIALTGATLVDDSALCAQWAADLDHPQHARRGLALREVEARLHRLAADIAETAAVAPGEVPMPQTNVAHVRRMASYLIAHAAEPLHMEEVAQHVGLHRHYAMTLFRRVTGVTLGDYLMRYRLAQAQRMLVTTDATILSIALTVGFQSSSQFYATFQRIVGMSPRTYRQKFVQQPQ